MDKKQKVYFRDQLRNARNIAIKDAEDFTELIFVFERIGSFLTHNKETLGKYREDLDNYKKNPSKDVKSPKFKEGLNDYTKAIASEIADKSGLVKAIPKKYPYLHITFDKLYQMVQSGRNSAMHQGAFARHLTQHAIELSLILEDALMSEDSVKVCDFMVRDPSCAYLWQPLSFIRQIMLSNSFSYMPVCKEGTWYLVSDYEIARYLRNGNSNERRISLASRLEDAINEAKGIKLATPIRLEYNQPADKAFEYDSDSTAHPELPILIFSDEKFQDLIGILTPFDLL